MSNKVSQIILLCEDQAQERLTRNYLKICKVQQIERILKPLVVGSFSQVLDQFPRELHACRQRHKVRANTLLIVLIDADNHSVEERRDQLLDRVKSARLDEFGANEPAVLLIPKRHIETWICALLCQTVTEEEDCKSWKGLDKKSIRQAAQTLFEWTRPNASPGPTCVPSLETALPAWHRVSG